jgi:A/G-specific adenine glycosylase
LLRWYDKQRRPLPWRGNRSSYGVWVAEVMLQQTRIAVVVPAYRRFLAAFPTLQRLAAAEESDVLSLWSGLGYYSRARALHRAAGLLREEGRSQFPSDYQTARRLPGVGPYTAAAVLSIAYGAPLAVVDGNVVRVLSRLLCLPRPDARGQPYATLAQQLLDASRPGDWNQALMELGETICTPAAPRCTACPWRSSCRAHRRNQVDRYPPPRPRRQRQRLELELHVLRDRRGRLLLERGAFAYLPHMWLPPTHVVDGAGASTNSVGKFRHAIVHRDFEVHVYENVLSATHLRQHLSTSGNGERALFEPSGLRLIGRSSMLTKALALCSLPKVPLP